MSISIVGKAESLLKEATCKRCLSVLKYAPIDVQYSTHTDYAGGRDKVTFITCPCCAEKVYVK